MLSLFNTFVDVRILTDLCCKYYIRSVLGRQSNHEYLPSISIFFEPEMQYLILYNDISYMFIRKLSFFVV